MLLSKKRWLFMIVCSMTLTMQNGCAKDSRGDFCSLYRPVYTSSADTEKTRHAADINNALWLEICPGYFYAP